jgi:hypothetical protein
LGYAFPSANPRLSLVSTTWCTSIENLIGSCQDRTAWTPFQLLNHITFQTLFQPQKHSFQCLKLIHRRQIIAYTN